MPPLSPQQLHRLINRYIGVRGGYLADFSWRRVEEFFLDLDVEIDPNELYGTSRERFIRLLNRIDAHQQATAIREILKRYPIGSTEERTQTLHDELSALADRLDALNRPLTATPVIENPSVVVRLALRDAERLIETNGAPSAVDRVHTALHGYLRTLCREATIDASSDASAPQLLNLILREHPRFVELGSRANDARLTLRTLGSIVEKLGMQRNNETPAHPNDDLLEEPEAALAIESASTIINYIEARLRRRAD